MYALNEYSSINESYKAIDHGNLYEREREREREESVIQLLE